MSNAEKNHGLTIQQLTRDFTTATTPLQILNGVDLTLNRGDALAITGPSGSGKSTLLAILGALDEPTSGDVRLLGENPFALSAAKLATYRNEKIGFIFQDHHLLPQCNVLENVLLPTLAAGSRATKKNTKKEHSKKEHNTAESRARELLERVGLTNRLSHKPSELSGGERQRVAVCRALINQPILLLADEPTGNLDRSTADSVGSLLLELNAEQNTILICVTHSHELAARFPHHQELKNGHLQPV